MSLSVPSKVIVASAVPSPTENVRPEVSGSVSVPCATVSVIRSAAPASSTS